MALRPRVNCPGKNKMTKKKIKRKILICDDHIESSQKWKSKLEELNEVAIDFEVEACDPNTLSNQIKAVAERRLKLRSGKPVKEYNDSRFDDLDVLIVDYDLQDKDPRSGREIAYLVRCFSNCGFVITINEHGENPFDLTLTGYADSFADLNIGSHQLYNSGLWKNGWMSFRPWSWPLIPMAVEKVTERISELINCVDNSILEFLGLLDQEQYLNKTIVSFLSVPKKAIAQITFRDFVLGSEMGLSFRDRQAAKKLDDQQIATIAAARISHWLERVVLPAQHILVDAPHLLSRFPSLRQSRNATKNSLNKSCQLNDASKLGMKTAILDQHRFSKTHWLSREAWLWTSLSKDKAIPAVADPFNEEIIDQRFCEDLSRFLQSDLTREFSADVSSQFVRRYLVDISLCKDVKLRKSLSDVQYHPSSRLAF
jgi:hypothetical protein